MKRKILVLFLLCSCLLLLMQKTLAQEVNLAADGYGERTISTDSNRKDVETGSEVENLTTDGPFREELDLNFDEGSGDDILDYGSTDTELEVGVGGKIPLDIVTEDTTENIETESKADILNEEVTQAEDSSAEKGSLATVEIQSTDDLRLSQKTNGLELNDANVAKIGKVIEDKYNKITEEFIAELTTLDASETSSEAARDNLNQRNEWNVTELNSEHTVTEEPRTEIASDPTTKTPEESVSKTDNTTTEATTRIPAPKLCTTPGTYAVQHDCRSYFTCAPTTIGGELQTTSKDCTTGQAFDKTLLRCSRDLSPCADTFDCKAVGTFADSTDNSSYYWCVASRLSAGLRIYHVKCGNGQIYTPELGKCFVDMTSLHNLSLNYDLYLSKSPDEECVREEINIMKAEEKVKLKEAKLREKIQRKYEKELLKKVANEAKEQAKLQGVSLEEQANFNCTQVGNFAAAAESFYDYFVCLSKKGNYKAVGMKCVDGQRF